MNEIEYIRRIKKETESYAAKHNLKAESTFNIDWGELQFLLRFITNEKNPPNKFISTNKENFIEHEQNLKEAKLVAYWLFLKEKGLDEEFEYFWHQMRQNAEEE